MGVLPEHSILLERMLRLVADAGMLERDGGKYTVVVGSGDPLPERELADPDAFTDRLNALNPHGAVELGLPGQSIAWGAWSGLGEA